MSGGWRFDLENYEGLAALANEQETLNLVGSYEEVTLDPRKLLKCENQGSQGSCRGHSGSTNLEWLYILATGETIQLSQAMCYYETQRLDNIRGDSGSTIYNGIILMKTKGLCTYPRWPYPPRYDNTRPADFEGVLREAATYRVGRDVRLSTYEGIRTHIGSGQGGVDLGIAWDQSYASPVVTEYRGGRGGHAIGLFALSERKDRQGRPFVWMFNSHGTRSGVDGWSEWSPSFIEGALSYRGNVFVGLSDMPHVKPREWKIEDTKAKLKWWKR